MRSASRRPASSQLMSVDISSPSRLPHAVAAFSDGAFCN
jgi:hypothetical protein